MLTKIQKLKSTNIVLDVDVLEDGLDDKIGVLERLYVCVYVLCVCVCVCVFCVCEGCFHFEESFQLHRPWPSGGQRR